MHFIGLLAPWSLGQWHSFESFSPIYYTHSHCRGAQCLGCGALCKFLLHINYFLIKVPLTRGKLGHFYGENIGFLQRAPQQMHSTTTIAVGKMWVILRPWLIYNLIDVKFASRVKNINFNFTLTPMCNMPVIFFNRIWDSTGYTVLTHFGVM